MKYTRVKPVENEMIKTSRVYLPSFSIDHKTLPEAKDWEVGKTYEVSLQLKLVAMDISENGGNSRFEIKGASVEDEE